jgi:hypothetical protein
MGTQKMTIAEAGNTEVPASLVLEKMGFLVRVESVKAADEEWVAERGDLKVIASSPVSLLGLVALIESRGHDWRASDVEIDEFLKRHRYE